MNIFRENLLASLNRIIPPHFKKFLENQSSTTTLLKMTIVDIVLPSKIKSYCHSKKVRLDCLRCGRNGHTAEKCYAKTLVNGDEIKRVGVYVLELDDGTFYIGKSDDINKRIRNHNALYVKKRTVVGEHPPLTAPSDDLEGWERSETLQRMLEHGVSCVRGWKYTSEKIDHESAFSDLVERFDLCRLCGNKGHFAKFCRKKMTFPRKN